jgi:hypothetical protein
MKKIPKQKKTNTREEKEIIQEYFIKCRNVFFKIPMKKILN